MENQLAGKVALITGGASGIGRAAALTFAREGARVVVADVDADGGGHTVALVQQQGGDALFVRCDVTQEADVDALIAAAVSAYGRLDCAFNNAGVEGDIAATAESTRANWDQVIAVNLTGVWLCVRAEIRQMLRQGGSGAIVNTASVGGLVAERGLVAYAAAKGGVIQITRTVAAEYARQGIRCNSVCPGVIETPMIDRTFDKMDVGAMAAGAVRSPLARNLANRVIRSRPVRKIMANSMHPVGRVGQPEEIAEAALWLCSDSAAFVTGHNLVVDGGMTAL